MRIPKFKVGDRVVVLRASTEDEGDLWGDAWMSEMSYNIGCVFTIEHIGGFYGDDRDYEYHKYMLSSNDGMSYPEFVLQNINVKGQQLLFDFMR